MRTIERRITVSSRSDVITIVPLFDLHIGTARCREDKLKAVIEDIRQSKNTYWLGGGDYAEFINRSDPRHKESDLARWLHGEDDLAKAQCQHLLKLLVPIADKCIGILSGNHEGQVLKHYERNVYAFILEAIKDAGGHKGQLGLGYRGFITLRINRDGHHINTLTIYAEHGWGGGRLKGGDVLNSQRIFAYFDCDLYLAGHRHKAHLIPHTMISARGKHIKRATKLAAMPGSFRDVTLSHAEDDPGSYEDSKGLPPGDAAGVKIYFEPDSRILRGEIFPY